MKKIEKLTPEQESQLAVYRDKWLKIGLSCEPADRAAAVAGANAAYIAAGLAPPKLVIWLDSPLSGAYGAAMLKNMPAQVGDQVWDQVVDQVVAQVGDQVVAQVGDQVWAQVGAQVRDQVGNQVVAQVRDQVWDQVVRAAYGQHDAGWLAFYDFFARQCGLEAPLKLAGLIETARACGWWWPFEHAVILTERPELLRRDAENRLHCEDGPALFYPDGFGLWAWHGVLVPQNVIETPDALTVDVALREQNAEIRRVMLLRIGAERLANEGGLRVLDEVADDQVEIASGRDGLPMPVGLCGGKLYELPSKDDMPAMRWVSLVNSTPEVDGSTKRYFLRVPPTAKSVREAVAWTFGQDAAEYRPEIET